MKKKSIRIKELAEALGLSQGTISIVLNGRGDEMRISKATQKKVLEGAKEMGYEPAVRSRRRQGRPRLVRLEQQGLERVLCLVFDAVNELGDHVELRLYMEVMGRYSNIIFVDEKGKIIDALKRVDAEMTSERLVLPGLSYELPPPQNKLCLLEATLEEALSRIRLMKEGTELSKAVLNSLQGVSPIVCRGRRPAVRQSRHRELPLLWREYIWFSDNLLWYV